MDLLNFEFVDFKEYTKTGNYAYTFVGMSKVLVFKSFVKFTFRANLPGYTWEDIQTALLAKQIYMHHLVYNKPLNLSIGKLTITKFTKEDVTRYGKCAEHWISLKHIATALSNDHAKAILEPEKVAPDEEETKKLFIRDLDLEN